MAAGPSSEHSITRTPASIAGGLFTSLMPGHTTDCISVYAWRPKSPPSRPMPLILKPPKGVSMLRCAVLMPTLPERSRPARRKPRSASSVMT